MIRIRSDNRYTTKPDWSCFALMNVKWNGCTISQFEQDIHRCQEKQVPARKRKLTINILPMLWKRGLMLRSGSGALRICTATCGVGKNSPLHRKRPKLSRKDDKTSISLLGNFGQFRMVCTQHVLHLASSDASLGTFWKNPIYKDQKCRSGQLRL